MPASVQSTRHREEEWRTRGGNPARLELRMGGTAGMPGLALLGGAVKAVRAGSDLRMMIWLGSQEGRERAVPDEAQEQVFGSITEQLRRGTIREYKRILCFDHDVLANDLELKSGIL